jgi:uncharacterized protein
MECMNKYFGALLVVVAVCAGAIIWHDYDKMSNASNSAQLPSDLAPAATSTPFTAALTAPAQSIAKATTTGAKSLLTSPASPTFPTLSIGKAVFKVGIARTDAEREQGLSGRKSLAANEGLLFIFDAPDYYGFWMKDMNFSIDVIWFDSSYRAVYIVPNMSPASYPQSYTPAAPAQYVLEVPAGSAAKFGIATGDVARFSPSNSK